MSATTIRPPGGGTVIWSGRSELLAVMKAAAGHETVPAQLADVIDLSERRSQR